MNQGTINFILQQMTGCLNNSQMMRLQNTLNESLQLAEDKSVERSSSELLEVFPCRKTTRRPVRQDTGVVLLQHRNDSGHFRKECLRDEYGRYPEMPGAISGRTWPLPPLTKECPSNRCRSCWDMKRLTPPCITLW